MTDKILIIPPEDKPVKTVYEGKPIVSEKEYFKAIENFINNIGHLNGMIPEDQIWLRSKGWVNTKDEFEKHLQQDK